MTLPFRSSSGFVFPRLAREIISAAHRGEHVFFLDASFMFVGNGAEQAWQVFQNGYTRFEFPCDFFGAPEYVRSASFNNAAVASGDELIRSIRVNSKGGIVVVVDENFFDGLPSEGRLGGCFITQIITQYVLACIEFMVGFPPMGGKDFRVFG